LLEKWRGSLESEPMFAEIKSVHFVGICGTAMASVAVAMQEKGFVVTGSDQGVYPPMSTFLAERGIRVMSGYAEANLDHRPDLVVIGNAISRGNPEAEVTLERRLRYCSLPELLKEFFIRGKRSLVVTGTHGKTTTTSLLTWVFESAGLRPSYLIGGIPNNLGQGARFTDSEWFIIEGDEYDTAFFDKRSKFVHYLPELVIINNIEFDHADIFENLTVILTSFKRVINLVPRNGLLLANGDDENVTGLLRVKHCPIARFGLGEGNDRCAVNLRLEGTRSIFELDGESFQIPLTGELNVRNALAVAACALHCGISAAQIRKAFDSFSGIKRRMEVRGEAAGITVVDDFGHHPTAIRETIRALRVRFPGRRLWAIFEPRTNTTRRNVFQKELSEALSLADAVVVSQIARLELLEPEERLDPVQLMREISADGKPAAYLSTVEEIVEHIGKEARAGDVVTVFSNGGFGGIHDKLLKRVANSSTRAGSL
jgi:UDP-N-acetylmuramate: L-alanyl-gamma-D-glutamyl-meso-diaminopimelate ligase